MDNTYFLIRVVAIKKIDLYFIKRSTFLSYIYNYPICFTASNTDILIFLLKKHNLVNLLSSEHSIYLGKELLKIDICLFSGQKYIQS
uniref:DUF4346 domain-containing protein n=1 Tax=Caloglossa intermedia TaxID=100879 RepID=A0A1Z1M6M0_9FLOR|nr:hypothetical protein [Caloglossa intermedia]ARW61415.1 hypothetical protein [Caloglossa intermedia]